MTESTKIRIRWDRIAGSILLGIVVGAMVWMWLGMAADHATQPADGGAPRCTDAIADAGGICHGEPLPPCPTEDSDNCYWNAATMGNGIGRSFITEHGQTVWLDAEGINE